MELHQDKPQGFLFIRACSADSVMVVDRPLRDSFAMAPDRLLEHWPVHDVEDLDAAASETLLSLDPELVLLGTGIRQRFPDRARLLPLLRKRVGVEVMERRALTTCWRATGGGLWSR